jgi:hypothetical protein
MDTLGDLSGSGSDSEKEEEGDAQDVTAQPAAKKKRAAALEPAPEELERLGYKSGPSVLAIPEPQSEAEPSWEWCWLPAPFPPLGICSMHTFPNFICMLPDSHWCIEHEHEHAWLRCGRAQGSKEERAAEPQEESFQEREHTRSAAGEGLEVAARLQRLAQEQVSAAPAPCNSQQMHVLGRRSRHHCSMLDVPAWLAWDERLLGVNMQALQWRCSMTLQEIVEQKCTTTTHGEQSA